MTTNSYPTQLIKRHSGVDARIANVLIEVKFEVSALRTLRESLMQVAYAITKHPAYRGYIVLVDSPITTRRLQDEWKLACSIFRNDVLDRLIICLQGEGRILGIPRDPDEEMQRKLLRVVAKERGKSHPARNDYSFVILKLLIHRWLTSGEPITSDKLASMVGCSYPALARVLRSLGSLLESRTDRKVALRWFPKDEYARLLAVADRARSTVRYVDVSGQPRSVESQVRRLEKMSLSDVAIGGVLGARHYDPDLDLVGTPRLDLSVHCPGRRMNLDFIEKLDPGLKKATDSRQPVALVVHAVRHAEPLFTPRSGGLAWADQVECLLDLHEARLEMQAAQFLEFLQKMSKGAS